MDRRKFLKLISVSSVTTAVTPAVMAKPSPDTPLESYIIGTMTIVSVPKDDHQSVGMVRFWPSEDGDLCIARHLLPIETCPKWYEWPIFSVKGLISAPPGTQEHYFKQGKNYYR